MGQVAEALVAWLALYTYPVAALTVLIGSLGAPLPSSAVVLAAGSFSTDGDPNVLALFAVVLGGHRGLMYEQLATLRARGAYGLELLR